MTTQVATLYHENLTADQCAAGAETMSAYAADYGGFHANTARDAARIARECATTGNVRGARNSFASAAAAAGRAAGGDWRRVWSAYVLFTELTR